MRTCLWIAIFALSPFRLAADDDPLAREIRLSKARATVYELLDRVSEASGLLFIYENGTVNNEKRARIAGGIYTLREAILEITGVPDLKMKSIGRHVLLYREPDTASGIISAGLSDLVFDGVIAEGCVRDRQSLEPLPSCSVALSSMGIGTVTNQNGRFALKIPDSLRNSSVQISHMGYHQKTLPLELFSGGRLDIYLDAAAVLLQEVVVRYVPPQKIIREMLDRRSKNYAKEPAYFTSFYREGVEYRDDFVSLTEGVCKVYKAGFASETEDHVKLLKMRRIANPHYPDSIMIKIQAGIRASFLLDIVQHLPDFLTPDRDDFYDYTRVAMETIDSGLVHVIAFEQKRGITEPMYKGLLYINADNWALVKADFEVNPRYVRQAGTNFIVRRSKKLDIDAQSIKYSVSYKHWDGYYRVNHIRGDLRFKVRKKRLFGGANVFNTYFEMATCEIDTQDVKRFPNRERLPAGQVFSETRFAYDRMFWERFNTIIPETQLTEAITRLLLTVEEQQE